MEIISNVLVLTVLVPLMNEIRFRQIGNRISMQLKFRHIADARAQANADCPYVKTQERDAVRVRKLGKIERFPK